METISQRRKRMETICVFYVISPMDSSNFPKEKKEDGDDLCLLCNAFLWFGLGLINVEHEEAPGSYGMDGFLSDQANAIPGIEEKELTVTWRAKSYDSYSFAWKEGRWTYLQILPCTSAIPHLRFEIGAMKSPWKSAKSITMRVKLEFQGPVRMQDATSRRIRGRKPFEAQNLRSRVGHIVCRQAHKLQPHDDVNFFSLVLLRKVDNRAKLWEAVTNGRKSGQKNKTSLGVEAEWRSLMFLGRSFFILRDLIPQCMN
ncbi:hypothetical protein RHSIM_Rhsim07G0183500 [Rhododendron simsii]|uniref:Uncharacterized protein n=1 Tax=Rhododendron simsii TaxID=118357 RepID=A0A834GR55_RHOSS|nr:hypothetical protein RHSIM_Rhsim07G0183500 [Rhododendron simsii]